MIQVEYPNRLNPTGGRSDLATRVGTWSSVIATGILATCPVVRSAEPALRPEVGRAISTALLRSMTDPTGDPYFRVGIANIVSGTGMRIGARGDSTIVEYLRGDGLLWIEAAEQVSRLRDPDTPMELTVHTNRLDQTSCPGMLPELEVFRTELDKVLGEAVSSTTPAPAPYEQVSPDGLSEIVVDGPVYELQIASSLAMLRIQPGSGSQTPLHVATERLQDTAGQCASRIPATITRHPFR